MRRIICMLLTVTMVFLFVGCDNSVISSDNKGGDTNLIPVSKVREIDVEKLNLDNIADKLYNLMPKDKNYMFSPLSIKMAFAMAALGADGETKEEILKAIDVESIEEFNDKSKWIIDYYNSLEEMELSVSNSIWLKEGSFNNGFNKDFEKSIAEYYSGVSKTVDANKIVNEINSWVKDKTKGKINEIIDNNEFDSMLLNAVYFKGKWRDNFSESSTKKDIFTDRNGNEKEIDFMNKIGDYYYYEEDGKRIVGLPYISYSELNNDYEKKYLSDFSMFIILSDEEDYNPAEVVENAIEKARKNDEPTTKSVQLSLPKFKTEFMISLPEYMKALGVEKVFSSKESDLSKMFNGENGYISDAIHKTFIEVDEYGTEAAAVTAVMVNKTAAFGGQQEPIIFKADKPFTFLIRDNTTGEVLFIGEYAFVE